MRRSITLAAAATLALAATGLAAQDGPAPQAPRPTFEEDGTVNVPAFKLPPSIFLSPEALALQKMRSRMPPPPLSPEMDIAKARAAVDAMMGQGLTAMRQRYAVDIAEQALGGVRTRVVTPRDKPFDKDRVLINVHGGGFTMCAESCAMLESIPISSLGGWKVVTVDYRMAPEHRHPAAVEDVEKVYRELLKSYKPGSIGLYGCSAGGALTAQSAAWMPRMGLPQFGAVGIFGAGAVRFAAGDSAYVTGYIDGSFPPPPLPPAQPMDITRGYFSGHDMRDQIISPALHQAVLAKFPPTLLITGGRAMDMTPAIYTNSQLLKAGVRSTLVVGEGMGHCYIYQSQLPEARDAYDVIVAFFREHLK
jgi:epsilon-lactone hydrolase